MSKHNTDSERTAVPGDPPADAGQAGGRPASPPGPAANGRPRNGSEPRAGVEELLAASRSRELRELYQFWGGAEPQGPATDEDLRLQLQQWMRDPAVIEERVAGLGKRLGAVLEELVGAPRYQRSWDELAGARTLAFLSEYDLQACVSALSRRGLVVETDDRRFERAEERVLAVPPEVGDGLLRRRRERLRGIFGVLTLRGHLDQLYSEPSRATRTSPQRLRELYKMYSQETASVARIERLPEGVRGLIEKAILEFGGVLPRQLFERMETELPHWNGRRWSMILEQSLVGTVQQLDLTPYGIQHQDETLIVFNEVALAWLRKVAVPSDPDSPYEELSLGIDLTSNVSRFLHYIDDNDVRYTVKGEIFKTTEKRILQHLIPNPGRELSREEVLSFVFRFCRHAELIARTGRRTFAVTQEGREWSGKALLDKQQALLDFALDDRRLPGEAFHQLRMRQVFLRLVKRVEPGVWYDLMYLPFLARNSYLSTLDDQGVEEHFAERAHRGRFATLEDPQRLAWNLVRWVRQRLYLLGVIDMGYDRAERPVAMRLTNAGARLLGMDQVGTAPRTSVGSLVVTPDFEVVLFPTGDDSQLVHDLDRFCVRQKFGSLMHFRVTQEAVRRALKGGMSLSAILGVLDTHSRTPLPQNVRFSIRDWALRAGLMSLGQDFVLRCHEPDVLKRFLADAGTRPYVASVLDRRSVQLAGRATPRRMQALLRELGYLVELGDGPA